MIVISEANEVTLRILKRFLNTKNCTRWMQYCVQTPVEDGLLVFNVLTREMVLLSQKEYDNFTDIDYLKQHWFVVPEDAQEKEYATFVRWMLSTRQPQPKEITNYTIFPTTDCNARCFYCFELGRSRIPMSQETAEKVVQYIKAHCGGKEIKISWFGGEPLFNMPAIETICEGLRRENIAFQSRMTTNGYLFDDEVVEKAVKSWNLDRVQITLDGTEKTYNKIKAYIYREGNPYQVVLDNIGRLLKARVAVKIRLNMDLYNADDLLILVGELAERFAGQKGLSVYAHHLFKGNEPMAELHTGEEWAKREEAMLRLEKKIAESDLLPRGGIRKQLRLNFCMADRGNAVTILPEGNIGLCEHFSETELIGNIDREGFDADMVASWRETVPEIPECATCFYYPDCIMLKKCSNGNICFEVLRQEQFRRTRHQMNMEYRRWQSKLVVEDEDPDF